MNKCYMCGGITFNSWLGYEAHMKEHHPKVIMRSEPTHKRTYVPINPVEKAKIVERVESRMKQWLLG